MRRHNYDRYQQFHANEYLYKDSPYQTMSLSLASAAEHIKLQAVELLHISYCGVTNAILIFTKSSHN